MEKVYIMSASHAHMVSRMNMEVNHFLREKIRKAILQAMYEGEFNVTVHDVPITSADAVIKMYEENGYTVTKVNTVGDKHSLSFNWENVPEEKEMVSPVGNLEEGVDNDIDTARDNGE